MEKLDPYFALGGRILLSLLFIAGGLNKFTAGPEAIMPFMESGGIPGFLYWPTVLFEVLGGLAILVGFKTRIIAFLLSGFCLITAVMFHSDFSQQVEAALFLKNVAIAGGFLILTRFGAGEFSIDGRPETTE